MHIVCLVITIIFGTISLMSYSQVSKYLYFCNIETCNRNIYGIFEMGIENFASDCPRFNKSFCVKNSGTGDYQFIQINPRVDSIRMINHFGYKYLEVSYQEIKNKSIKDTIYFESNNALLFSEKKFCTEKENDIIDMSKDSAILFICNCMDAYTLRNGVSIIDCSKKHDGSYAFSNTTVQIDSIQCIRFYDSYNIKHCDIIKAYIDYFYGLSNTNVKTSLFWVTNYKKKKLLFSQNIRFYYQSK